MSDGPVVNVEDELPPEQPVAKTPAPEPPAAEPEDSDLEQVDPKDESRIRGIIAALGRERAKTQSLKEKAARTDQLEAYAREVQPYVEVLRQNPGLLRQQPAPPEPVREPTADPDVLAYAKGLQLYKADGSGQFDLETASTLLNIAEKRADAKMRQHVEPLQQDTYQTRSRSHFQQALQTRDMNGNAPDPHVLQRVWQSMPIESTADPEVAGMLVAQAFGLSHFVGQPKVPAPGRPPVETESLGAPTPRTQKLSELEQSVLKQRGMKVEDYLKHTANYRPGRTNVVEED